MQVTVRRMTDGDIGEVAQIHQRAFIRQHDSRAWIECNYRAFPRMQYFVAETEERIVGWIHWTEKSGFRSEVVLELEQLAVDPDFQGRGVGKQLIKLSVPQFNEHIRERGARLKHIMVNTRADNYAQRLYRNTLGAEVEATIKDLYSADEVFMVARNFEESELGKQLDWTQASGSHYK
jgi:ribosomal protein S18 acetylase RimI-like enzyme